jgi:hypothetical protein
MFLASDENREQFLKKKRKKKMCSKKKKKRRKTKILDISIKIHHHFKYI